MFGKRADACVGCRACEPRCPQRIVISERMKEVAATFKRIRAKKIET